MMTLEEAVAELDKCQYTEEVSKELRERLKESGIVVVYGSSDDLMEFEGAWYDEAGIGTYQVDSKGLVESECDEGNDCPYFKKILGKFHTIKSLWCENDEGYSWTYKTDIPHLTFRVMEDDEPYCLGIVFYAKDADKIS